MPDEAVSPSGQVVANQQIEDVLATFDAPTRRALREVMIDTSATLGGNDET